MIISRTPFRISFFGGSTDYPVWYRDNPGAVLATSVDKYCYISCRYLPPFFEHKYRIVWSQIELVQNIEEIRHSSVRECLKFMNVNEGVEIHYEGDLPAMTGMGTSSSFTVGLLHALCALKGTAGFKPTKMALAKNAIHIEQDIIRENIGSQDQVTAAFGGLNRIDFGPGDDIRVSPIRLTKERLDELQSHLMLLYTGVSRTASYLAGELIKSIPYKRKELEAMQSMVGEAISILEGNGDLAEFGKLLHKGWQLKRSLTPKTSSLFTDYAYESALQAGAVGGKILGAGGGGFILLFVEPSLQERVRKSLRLLHVPFRFDTEGSKIVVYQP